MMMTGELQMPDVPEEAAELIATVEEIRVAKYPNLDRELVNAILSAQYQFAEDRAEARKRTKQLVNKWAATQSSKSEASA
jgi:hypothetical protein